ncbi:MAG: hypothetical protein WBM80_09400 [Woeseiaceae bacterium]
MNRFTPFIISTNSYVYSIKGRAQISSDDRMSSAKLVTGMIFFLPLGGMLALLVALIGSGLNLEDTKVLLAVVTVVAFFLVSGFTDRVHDRNVSEIKELAYQICVDPERGENWAKRQLLLVVGKQFALIVVIAVLGRAAFVVGTDTPFVKL